MHRHHGTKHPEPMKAALIFWFLCCAGITSAREIVVVLTENIVVKSEGESSKKPVYKTVKKLTRLTLELSAAQATQHETAPGAPVPSTTGYTITDRHLTLGETTPLPADQILAQARIDGVDVVITQRSYVSANPRYWFYALSGHPAQFSEILAVVFDGKTARTADLTKSVSQSSASSWSAALFEIKPASVP